MDRFYGQHGHWFRVLNLGGPPVSLTTLIADTRKAVTDDAANARATVSAQGTLVGITEVDVRTGAYLHGGRAARTRWCRRGGEPGSVRPGIARVMPGDHLPLPGRAVAVAPSGWPGRADDPAAQCAPGPRPGRRRSCRRRQERRSRRRAGTHSAPVGFADRARSSPAAGCDRSWRRQSDPPMEIHPTY